MARRMKKKLAGLGAVEGEKVEYFLPAAIFNATAKDARNTVAYCIKDVEAGLLANLDYQAELAAWEAERARRRTQIRYQVGEQAKKAILAEKQAATKSKASSIFRQTADEIRKDLAAIRAKGITGPIPVCVYRTSGKYGDKALKTAEARATRFHERFHADSRREEYKLGVEPYSCDAGVKAVLGGELDPDLVAFSRTYWSPSGRAANEEILARVEEVENACAGDGADCNDVFARINDWFVSKGKPELAKKFYAVTRAVKKTHGSPLATFRAACKVPANLRGFSKKEKAFLLATAIPFVPPL